MKIKLVHPLRSHIPALTVFIVLIIWIIASLPLPAEAPVHFGAGGIPNRYASPWEALGITLGISVLFLALAVLLDELWARQEKKKYFNWVSLLDEIVIGAMTGINIGFLSYLNSGTERFSFPWGWLALFCGGATLLAVVFELKRPYRPHTGKLTVEENPELKSELEKHLAENSTFVYWDSQNPLYIAILTIVLPVGLIAAGIATWVNQPLISLVQIIVGIGLLIPLGGQRIIVTREDITVRWGIIGLRVLNLKMAGIAAAELHDFTPLKDFGGYGIRRNREIKAAYYLSGSRAVKLETVSGEKYLVGSDHPENLATVIRTIIEHG